MSSAGVTVAVRGHMHQCLSYQPHYRHISVIVGGMLMYGGCLVGTISNHDYI